MHREVCYDSERKIYFFAERDEGKRLVLKGRAYEHELPPHVAAAARGARGQYVDWPATAPLPPRPPLIVGPQPWHCWELVVVGLGVVGVLLIWFATWASVP